MFKSRKNRNHKPINMMNAEQERIIRAMLFTLQEGDYDTARDLVTKVEIDKYKKEGYMELANLACRQGNIFRMMEVTPFRGFPLSEEEIRDCLEQALKNGDLRNVLQCKKILGEEILTEELRFLRESLGESIIPGYQSSRSYLIEFIKSRLGDTLTSEEVLRLKYIEIQIDRSNSD